MPGVGTEEGANLVASKIGDVHALFHDAVDHADQPTVELAKVSFDQMCPIMVMAPFRRCKCWQTVAEDGLVSVWQANADAKQEADHEQDLVRKQASQDALEG